MRIIGFRSNGLMITALIMTGALVLVALCAPWLAPEDPRAIGDLTNRLAPPGVEGALGTDVLGRDILSRLLYGARVSLAVGVGSVIGVVTLGLLVGLAAALGPRWLDRLLMGLTDLFLAFPRIFLVLLLVAVAAPSLNLVVIVIVTTGWMGVARLVRAESLSLRERDYVLAAEGLGLSTAVVAWRHVLPHVVPLVLVAAALRLSGAILLEAFLSYLGLGAQDPAISWGAMVEHGRPHMVDAWWVSTLPGLAIAWTAVGCNLLGDALRDRWDPRRAHQGGGDE